MPKFWTRSQIRAIGGPRGGLCPKCGWDLDSHPGLIVDQPGCRTPKRQLPSAT